MLKRNVHYDSPNKKKLKTCAMIKTSQKERNVI